MKTPDTNTYLVIALITLFAIFVIYVLASLTNRYLLGRKSGLAEHFGLKKNLITGVLVWLPIVICLWLVITIVEYSDHLIRLLPPTWRPENMFGFALPGYGVVVCLILLFVTGLFASNVLGRKIVETWDRIISHIPVIKTVYGSVKKVSESLFSDSKQSFKTPILVQFPHRGAWTVAFISGSIPSCFESAGLSPETHVAVYVPTTPNPTSGYYIMVRLEDTRPVNLSVDEALKYVISVGMVMPELPPSPFAEPVRAKDGKAIPAEPAIPEKSPDETRPPRNGG